jgi:hypothetical protein
MARTYSNEVLRVSYHNANPSDYAPTDQDLDDWDASLQATYASRLDGPMAEAGIHSTPVNRSWIVLLAELSNGQAPLVRVRNACKYFANTWEV